MNKELLDILSQNNDQDLNSQKLLDYLNGKLSEQEKNEVERLMADNPLLDDAMEGLRTIKDKSKLQAYVVQLQKDLHRYIQKKHGLQEKHRLPQYSWVYLSIVLILVLCIVGYLVVRLLLQ
jgi:anti-sigma factor RsiW